MARFIALFCLLSVLDHERFTSMPGDGVDTVLFPSLCLPSKGSNVIHEPFSFALISMPISSGNFVCSVRYPSIKVLQDCFFSAAHSMADLANYAKAKDVLGVSIKRCLILMLLFISGNVQPNPGPTTPFQIDNPAVQRQRLFRTFQTVNHAKVVWDPKIKPRGLFGGHLNIRSMTAKSDQVTHLLSESNLDFICLSETWLKQSSSTSVFTVPGYQCFRRDRLNGKGGGVLFYVKDDIKCERVIYKAGSMLEYVGIKIILSEHMSFNILGVYRPPSGDDTFYDQLAEVLKECNHNKELLLMGDFNVNWEDKSKRKKLKNITEKFNLEQLVKGPTRITKCSSTQIDLIFSNKPERITKSYNLVTGLSDHNLTLCARKLTKNRFRNSETKRTIRQSIPRAKQEEFVSEINSLKWDDVLSSNDLDYCCDTFIHRINSVRERFTVPVHTKPKKKTNLPWFNENLWKMMKSRDAALLKALKTRRDTDILLYRGLRNKVICELRLAKSRFFS